MTTETITPTKRGTSNANERGSSYTRRSRRAWIVLTYASNVPGFARCYRCGGLLFNPDEYPTHTGGELVTNPAESTRPIVAYPLTIDRIIPGCKGGTYRRNNIRPACGMCNSETGGALAEHGKKTKA